MIPRIVTLAKSEVILSKVERAKKHIKDLESALRAFLSAQPHAIRFEDDPNKGERSYYFVGLKDIPPEISNIIGDVLHNLRSALDHLAYALPLAPGERKGWNQFPIVESAAIYMSPKVRGKVQVFREDAVKAFDALKPYKGGNDTLWRIHQLNKVDKHRLLLTACIANTARTATPTERARIAVRFFPNREPSTLEEFLKGIVAPVPLNAGDKLHTILHSEMEEKVQFHFDVAFNEPQIIECKPVVVTLHQMTKLIGNIVLEFAPLLT